MRTANEIARRAIRDLADLAQGMIMTDQCNSRAFDDCFENCCGAQVDEMLCQRALTDHEFARKVMQNSRFMSLQLIGAAEGKDGPPRKDSATLLRNAFDAGFFDDAPNFRADVKRLLGVK